MTARSSRKNPSLWFELLSTVVCTLHSPSPPLTQRKKVWAVNFPASLPISFCGWQDLVDPATYVSLFPAAFAPLRSQFNISAIQDLYSLTDFIGISSYPSLAPNFTTQQLEAATEQFDFEIGEFGVDLKDLNINQVSLRRGGGGLDNQMDDSGNK
jgi:hypothetical protein